jgi:hypothetical protein
MLVQSWEKYCKKYKIDPVASLPDLSNMPEALRASFLADYKLQILIDEVNDHIEANWEDGNENKYFIWWWMNGVSGSGFRLSVVYHRFSSSGVGSRYTFRTLKGAEHAAKYFFDLFKVYMMGK